MKLTFNNFSHLQAVKLESLRAGRTRYLVVVSRPVSKQTQQNQAPSQSVYPSTNVGSVTSQLGPDVPQTSSNSGFSLNPTSYFNEATGSCNAHVSLSEANESAQDDGSSARLPVVDENQCETESSIGSSCSRGSSNELEESCLLGIDVCNEKTTVGLVLRVLADTAIRLDGDG